jgi:hypothetical protein
MAGGSLTVTATNYAMLKGVGQRILCWMAAANRPRLRTSTQSNVTSFVVPEEAFGAGSLVLRRGGTDLVAGYVAGTNIAYNVSNLNVAVQQNANTCPSSAAQPTILGLTTNVGANPLAVTLNYANVAAAGTVNVDWGDGTSTLGAAESNAALAHTYTLAGNFPYRITVADASVPTDSATAVFVVPGP